MGPSRRPAQLHPQPEQQWHRRAEQRWRRSRKGGRFAEDRAIDETREYGSGGVIDIWFGGQPHEYIIPLENGARRIRSMLRHVDLLPRFEFFLPAPFHRVELRIPIQPVPAVDVLCPNDHGGVVVRIGIGLHCQRSVGAAGPREYLRAVQISRLRGGAEGNFGPGGKADEERREEADVEACRGAMVGSVAKTGVWGRSIVLYFVNLV